MNGHHRFSGNRESEQNPAYGLLQPHINNGPSVKTTPTHFQALWRELTNRLQQEWLVLGDEDRAWISGKIELLTDKQQQLHHLVTAVDGEIVCRDCAGACCEHGLYHPTLVTILAHLVVNHPLPVPDFEQSCPYLGVVGCQFPPHLRPYNCLTFICDKIDDRYTDDQQHAMLTLELELREIYEAFDTRYSGSTLRGLLNRKSVESLRPLLERQDTLA